MKVYFYVTPRAGRVGQMHCAIGYKLAIVDVPTVFRYQAIRVDPRQINALSLLIANQTYNLN